MTQVEAELILEWNWWAPISREIEYNPPAHVLHVGLDITNSYGCRAGSGLFLEIFQISDFGFQILISSLNLHFISQAEDLINTFNSCLYTSLATYMSININSTLYNLENKGNMLTSQLLPAHKSRPWTPIRKRRGLAAFGSTEVAEKGDQP